MLWLPLGVLGTLTSKDYGSPGVTILYNHLRCFHLNLAHKQKTALFICIDK